MKKYLWFFGALLLAVFVGFNTVKKAQPQKVLGIESKGSAAPVANYPNVVTFDYQGRQVTAAWYKIDDTFNLSLIANFDQKENAKDVFEEKACKFLSSAGFYTEGAKPTGLFLSEGVTYRNFSANKLTDGILSVNYFGTPRITRAVPKDTLRLAVQTGPILKENSEYQKLNIAGDEEARRVVAAVTGANELYFIVFYDKGSAYNGPSLQSLPEVLKAFEEKARINFADAVNLDGGTASTFYVKGFSLSELSPVGAFFCEK